jgi:molybdopterin-binding protein
MADKSVYSRMQEGAMQRLLAPREASNILGISYPTLKQWIYHKKIKTLRTPGGHHRVPESEIDRLIPKRLERGELAPCRSNSRKISVRNQLMGRVVALKFGGLIAQFTLAIGEQHVTAIIASDAANDLCLKVGERAAALIKSTEVMILLV